MKREIQPSRGLAAEIRQTKPFGSLETEALLNLVRTTSELDHRLSTMSKRHGLSQPQYNVLRILRGAGEEGLRCGEVASRMLTRVPDVSRLLDRLHTAGLVTRQRDDDDRRVVRMRLSEQGRSRLLELDEPIEALTRQLLSALSEPELRQLIDLLEKIRQGV